jgi:hypothetical protein
LGGDTLTWNWGEIAITVLLTVAGSVAIAFSTIWFQDRTTKKLSLNSLLSEVRHNTLLVNQHKKQIEDLKGIHAPEGLKELQIDAYLKVREMGYILNMPEELRLELFNVYNTIDGIRRGRYDYVAYPLEGEMISHATVVSPYRIDPQKPAITPLLIDLPKLESDLKTYLKINTRRKTSVK